MDKRDLVLLYERIGKDIAETGKRSGWTLKKTLKVYRQSERANTTKLERKLKSNAFKYQTIKESIIRNWALIN